ncbi:expressed unknown protein [Seminavis robusta]|uniref:Uncharacterized protein n=1 Tax=Seminavis robusta TaxID=568900 RepID=A0A9N8ENQ0_9STRA|nr:expressed unknown protein [Seminavis robusta]|eukprot:Sro1642_g288000.1 n/a (369) ;mRNA; f:4062-5168
MPSMVAALAAAAASSRLSPLAAITVTDLLKENDKTLWKLKLYKDPASHFEDFDSFCRALSENTTVTSLEVTWRFLRHLTQTQRITLMEAIGGLANLEEIAIEVVGPTFVLTAALRKASKLKSLRIGKLRFLTNQDVQGLAAALLCCKNLQQLSLSSVQIMVQGNHIMDAAGIVLFQENQQEGREKIGLDPLLDAMASLPVLEHIRLQHYLSGSKIQPPTERSLRSLCHSPRRSLIFGSCGLSDEQCVTIADELKTNRASSDLSILVVTRNYKITSFGWDVFVQMLAKNETLLDFHPGEEGQRNAPSTEQKAKINYYLKLNQAGRGKLRGSMTERRKAWFDLLVQGSKLKDLDIVFFAMQVDPSLYIID